MHATAYALLFVGAIAGGFVSGLAGFGTALMALGIWLYVLPPSLAVPLVLICSVVAQTSTLPSMWKSFDLTLVWPFLIGGLAGVPLGTILVAQPIPMSSGSRSACFCWCFRSHSTSTATCRRFASAAK
jgi:uncharacterized membrane protein YfcA